MLLEHVSRENKETRCLKFQEIFYPTENVTESYVKPKEEYQFCLSVLTKTLSLLTENTHYHNNLCERTLF